MRAFVDCEFNGYGGDPFAMAIVKEDASSIYLVDTQKINELNDRRAFDLWAKTHVLPFINAQPVPPIYLPFKDWHQPVAQFLFDGSGAVPQVFTDWPADISILCDALVAGPGEMADSVFQMHFTMLRVNAYPTSLQNAIPHNAWWDAMALRQWLIDHEITS